MTTATFRSTNLPVLVIGFLLVALHTNAQTLVPSAQHSTRTDKIIWSGSIGEPIIQTGFTGPFTLTQGFHQPTYISVQELEDADVKPAATSEISIFPNPFRRAISIETEMAGTVSVFDVQGTEVIRNIPVSAGINTVELQHLPKGKYIFLIRYSPGSQMDPRSFEAIKI